MKIILKPLVFFLCILFCPSTKAIEPSEFENMPLSSQCFRLNQTYQYLLSLKKQGLERTQAHTFFAQSKLKQVIPEDAINRAYDYPELNNSYLATYAHLACHAKEVNFPIRPFESVIDLIKECQRKTHTIECENEIRNMIIGLQKDHKRNESTLRPVTPDSDQITKAPTITTIEIIKYIKLESIGCKIAYPEESRIKGQTGVSAFEIILNADGIVTSASVTKSSGYRMLDNAGRGALLSSCDLSKLLRDGVKPDSKIHVTYYWALE